MRGVVTIPGGSCELPNMPCCGASPHPGAYRFCYAMIKIREEIEDIAQGRVPMDKR